ncbi:MAG TPA: hypothetical protein VLJ12_10735 [Burkholderiales bacterium]|nr:hypothetical protein [Burkholderiales bacterium]
MRELIGCGKSRRAGANDDYVEYDNPYGFGRVFQILTAQFGDNSAPLLA